MKAPIRWAGSTRQTVHLLKQYWTGERYIEPFAGSACLFFEIEPREAILGDRCAEIYDQIEALTRRVAKRSFDRGLWKATKEGTAPPTLNLKKAPWAAVVRTLMHQLDPGHSPYIPEALLARVLGITPHRNDAGHEPNSKNALIRRDREQRTRFETAADLLADLINACKTLRV